MCAVGEKLIEFPDNCGVVDFSVPSYAKQQDTVYPEINVRFSTDFFHSSKFQAKWNAWKPAWLQSDGGISFIVKAPGVANWCAECNVMQALPCFQFRCAACDNDEWEKDMIVDAWCEWRRQAIIAHCEKQGEKADVSLDSIKEWFESLESTRDHDSRDDDDYDSDRGCDWDRRSWDSDSTYIPWRGCHMQD
jgi:hypothetical protein